MGVKLRFKFEEHQQDIFTIEFAQGKEVEIEHENNVIHGFVRHSSSVVGLDGMRKADVTLQAESPKSLLPAVGPLRSDYQMWTCINNLGMEDTLVEGYMYPLKRLFSGGMAEVIVDGIKIEMFIERFEKSIQVENF